jgi:hypothetical protein
LPPDILQLPVRPVVPASLFSNDFQMLGSGGPRFLPGLQAVAMFQFFPGLQDEPAAHGSAVFGALIPRFGQWRYRSHSVPVVPNPLIQSVLLEALEGLPC